MNDNRIIAEFLSLTEPTAEQKEKLESFLKNKYNRLAEVKWVKDETVKKGFKRGLRQHSRGVYTGIEVRR